MQALWQDNFEEEAQGGKEAKDGRWTHDKVDAHPVGVPDALCAVDLAHAPVPGLDLSPAHAEVGDNGSLRRECHHEALIHRKAFSRVEAT